MSDNGNGKLAAIYARVSSEEQAKGYSLPTQVEGCLELAKKEGYTVPEGYIFQEDITGMILDRPLVRKVRELVNTKAVHAVIVHEPDRLARKLAYQLLLDEEMERAGVRLLFVLHQREGNPEGTLFFHMRGALAEYERAKIMERTRRGMIGRARAGHPNGGQVPLGYRYISEKYGGHFEIVEEEGALVRRIFSLCLEGKSTRAIAKKLTEERIPTKTDRGSRKKATNRNGRGIRVTGPGEWGWSTIADILTNEAYIGHAYWNKRKTVNQKLQVKRPPEEWIEIPTLPIISEETFQATQVQLTRNKVLAKRNQKNEYLLRGGRLCCGRCGRNMVGHAHKVRRYRCSSCNTFMDPAKKCGGYLRADEAEADIWQAVERVLMNPELIAQEVARQQENSGAIQAEVAREMELIESVLAKCDKEEKRWAAAYAGEVIDLAELKGYKAEIATRRESLQGRRAELQARLEAIQMAAKQTKALVDYCGRVRENLKSFDSTEKQLALEALNIRATWTPGEPLAVEGSISMGVLCTSRRPVPVCHVRSRWVHRHCRPIA